MKITIIICSFLIVSSFLITNEEARIFLKGIESGYSNDIVELNKNCLDQNFNDDFKELIESMNNENYAFMTLKIHKIGYEIYTNCTSPTFEKILNSAMSLPGILNQDILKHLGNFLEPIMDIYNSETKTFYEWGYFIGGIIKKADNITKEEEPINTDL